MTSIKIGLDVTDNGLEFYGSDEVNDLISKGARVVSIVPSQFFIKPIESDDPDDNEKVVLKGWEMNVLLEH